ncbi:SGNH/GDSL hydrolase family protein [Clavibacter sepedonicus]|uniref:Lipoprotein n=1 Tax=Clavibacter sepedonicus TaxID=31964 RepID=B0RG54_CLASE|nr:MULTISPECIES: GDSL-type esterase/lipase family protein [Clavibacter]MBD5383307.1 esterase [Clavibacter sp.]OQJ47942.1 esterase [Clavibacter sepedonicus]OQJ53499.1 esterase [Clavibacter sepedonicus]UUK66394.1 GDSL-type esterase/lipase family protein [Clavibacter sepedonicus]CAQ02345.1 putative lipoprotein [Clavibacter sepedonicus]
MPARRMARGAVSALAAVLLLAGCTSANPQPTPTTTEGAPEPSASASTAPEDLVRIVVMGDSNTNGFVGTLPQGIDQGMAYVDYVVGDPLTFAGGWGTDGATSTVMAANTPTVEDVDIALIMIGTNNRIAQVPDTQLDADILQTVEKLAPKDTVILAIPPQNASPETPPEVNAHLEQFAEAQGYHFFNPWKNLTNKDMKWRSEFFRDGIHTNMKGYKLMGAEVRNYVRTEVLDDADAQK